MRSGDPNYDRSDAAVQEAFARIRDRKFAQLTFHPKPALIKKEPVNGHRMWKEYGGEAFDETEFTKVDGYWDHEHCSVCGFKITEGHTYWTNANGVTLLCDECHDVLMPTEAAS